MSTQKNHAYAMPRLNWVRTGTDHAETVVLIHAVGYDLTYWDRQIEAFLPLARAVCGNSARTDLRGGRAVRLVPTATETFHLPVSALYGF
jgi:pimeloyl-ACP methyl ester carboxylesterase